MFDNIGRKIKGLATFKCWIGIIACVITGIGMIVSAFHGRYTDSEMLWMGIGVGVVGSLLSWVGSFVLYGFGTLVENSENLSQISKELKKKGRMQPAPAETSGKAPVSPAPASSASAAGKGPNGECDDDWICPKCGAKNRSYCVVCPDCLTKKPAQN